MVDVAGADGRRLGEQLRETSSWRRRFALVDQFLLGRLDRRPRPSPEVGRAWERLVATGGAVPIGQLAKDVGWSHKHLIARFTRQVGLRPKSAARLVRFDGVWRRLDQRRPLDYDTWAGTYGCAGWGYAELLSYFHRAEDQQRGASPFHGVGGRCGSRSSRPGAVAPRSTGPAASTG